MALTGVKHILLETTLNSTKKINFSTTSWVYNYWRKKQGVEPNPNKYSVLYRTPDFSFVDGRPVPLGLAKKVKLERQKKYCERIVELSNELDVGLKLYEEKQIKEKEKLNEILRNRLKEKGAALNKTEGKGGS